VGNSFGIRVGDSDGDKYNYSQVNYINCSTKVKIICPNNHEFYQTPTSYLIGRSCPKCKIYGYSKNLWNDSNMKKIKETFLFNMP